MKVMQRKDITDDEVLDAVRAWRSGGPGVVDQLSEKYPPKVVLAKIEAMVEREILDYGTSVNYPWIRDDVQARGE